MNEPIRRYPLQMITLPRVYIMGEKQGQRVPGAPDHVTPPGFGGVPGGLVGGGGGGAGAMNMLTAQNANMANLEQQRREQERIRITRERMAGAGAVSFVSFLAFCAEYSSVLSDDRKSIRCWKQKMKTRSSLCKVWPWRGIGGIMIG